MSGSSPLISVLIPVYNVAPFVEEAIRSIKEQTYTNLEIILVDDASTDNTYQIIERLAKEDDRIKLYRNKRNSKIVKSLNYGLGKTRGEYIVRMDGDDISLPSRIEEQYNFLVQNPEVDIVGVNVIVIDEVGTKIHNEEKMLSPENCAKAAKYMTPLSHIWMTKKSVYDKIGYYRIPSAEDLDFLLRALSQGFNLANLPGYLYAVRQREGNTATTQGLKQMKSIAYARKLYRERLQTKELKDSYSDEKLKRATASSKLEEKMFDRSAQFHLKYLREKSKNKIKSIFWRGMSVVFSPKFQIPWIYNRWKYKKIIQNSNTQ